MLSNLLLAAVATVAASLPTSASPDPEFLAPVSVPSTQSSIQELVAIIRKEGNNKGFDVGVFRRLSDFQDEASLRALQRCVGDLRPPNVLAAAYGSLQYYKDAGTLGSDALEFLADEARKHKRDGHRRAAVKALLLFGDRAVPELEILVDKSKDEDVRRIACNPLVPFYGQRSGKVAATVIVENAGTGDHTLTYLGLSQEASKPWAGKRHREVVIGVLASLNEPAARSVMIKKLLGRKTGGEWKQVLIQALGEQEGDEITSAFADLLDDKDKGVVLAAIEALATRPAHRGAASKLEKLVEDEDPAVRRLAIISLAEQKVTDPAWQKRAVDLARSKDAATRMGAAVALGVLRTQEAIETLYFLLADPDWSVRVEALQRVGNLRRKDSIPHLIRRLGAENGRIKGDVAAVLRLITGLDLGRTPTRWKMWWTKEGAEFVVPEYELAMLAERERAAQRAESSTSVSFYGLRVVSDRVIFILDQSGSMTSPAGSAGGSRSRGTRGPTRIDVAKEQLINALEAYPLGNLFNVLFFSNGVASWQDTMVEMDEPMREDTIAYTEDRKAGGGTAVFTALERAFEDPLVDTIYIMTDGAPTAGAIVNPARIREEVARWNSARHVQINSVAVGQDSPLLRWLAEDSGGKYVRVD